jgi:hypothetical protein
VAHFNTFGELIVNTLTQSNKESNLNRSSAVPIADDARPPMLTFVHNDAATVWLKN